MKMGAEGLTASTASKAAARCGACGHVSSEQAKFCAGCGQSLFEACGGCGKPVLLDQKFCGLCGCNLEQELQKRCEAIQGWMAEAVECTKKHAYDQAIMLLNRAADPPDYRFADLAAQAKLAVEKVKTLRQRAVDSAEALQRQAKDAFDRDEKAHAARYIQQIPEPLRSDESKQILASSIAFLGQQSSLVADLQNSIKDRDWILAGSLLGQAIALSPDDPQYKTLGAQVSNKLYKLSEKYFQKCDYTRALDCLNAIPKESGNSEHEARYQKLELVDWLSQQFDGEAFATATLGRLAIRFAKESTHDPAARDLVKQLAAQVKQKAETPRDPWASWKADRMSWCGGPAGFLAYPQAVQFRAESNMRKLPGRFNVAIGLAAQGLELGRIKQNFVESKGLLAGFGRRKKKNSVWGIDIGSSAIHAALISRDEEGELIVEGDYHACYDAPTCRTGQEQNADETVSNAIESMLEEIELGEAPVWVNLPAGELVTRFVRLPPLGDKQAKAMLKAEAEQRIPLAIDDLRLVEWIGEQAEHKAAGRPAAVAAARKTVVDRRLQLCEQAGLKVTGMQADSLALVNFADVEFADLWSDSAADEKNEDSSGQDQQEQEDHQRSDSLADQLDAVLMLDSGAASTTLVIVSAESFWFWNVESAGEVLTTAIAGSANLMAAEAEQRKHNPANLDDPGHQFQIIEQRMDELRGRLKKMVDEAKKQDQRFKITESWCFGGACLTHQWIRRVMLTA